MVPSNLNGICYLSQTLGKLFISKGLLESGVKRGQRTGKKGEEEGKRVYLVLHFRPAGPPLKLINSLGGDFFV